MCTQRGWTALMVAIYSNSHTAAMPLLIDKGAEIEAKDNVSVMARDAWWPIIV